MPPSAKKIKQLESRVAVLEAVIGALAMRLTLAVGSFNENVQLHIHGVRTVRGNDGVPLATHKEPRR